MEDTFRNTKQFLGGEDPQTWKGAGPVRAAALSFYVYAVTWSSYLATWRGKPTWCRWPWYPSKATPSFADALAALRRKLWRARISSMSAAHSVNPKILRTFVEVLANAA